MEVVFDILDGKNTLIFFLLWPNPLRKKSYHSYWQWGRNFVLRNFLVVCGCDFPFF